MPHAHRSSPASFLAGAFAILAILAVALAARAQPFAYVPSTVFPGASSLNVIDVSSGSLVATVPAAGFNVQHVAVDPAAGNRIYLGGSAAITVIEATSNTKIATFDVPGLVGMAIDDTGSLLFVATDAFGGPQLHALNAHTGAEMFGGPVSIDENPGLLAYNPHNHTLYVAHSHVVSSLAVAGTLDVWDFSGGTFTQNGSPLTVGKLPGAVAVSDDGNHVYVANEFDNSISVVDTSDNSIVTVPTISSVPKSVGVDRVSGHVFVAGFGGACATIDEYDGSSMATFAPAPSTNTDGIGVTHDGSHLVTVDSGTTYSGCPLSPATGGPAGTVTVYPLPYSGSGEKAIAVATPIAFGTFIGPDTIQYTPNAPTIGTVTSSTHNQATVPFTAPAADPSGLPVTLYTVTGTDGTHTSTATGTSSPITVTGLNDDSLPYTFTVFATNANGDGAISAPSNAVSPQSTLAAAPGNVTAIAGNGQATVSFTLADDGGLTIGNYVVTASPGGVLGGGLVSPITVTGLTNGTHYTFTVVAVNARGAGPASAPSNDVVPIGPPTQPIITSSVPGNGQATIFFNPPANDGGVPITSYVVTSSPGGFTASGSGSPLVVTGLANHTTYTFTVVAINSQGASPSSNPSADTVPFVTPDPPTNVAAVVSGGGTMRVTCTPPASQGESAVTSYTVTSAPGGVIRNSGTNVCNLVVSGLTPGTSYTFTAVAQTSLGPSPPSAPSSAVIAATTPGAPTAVSASLTSATTAQVTFTPPASDGFAPITDYIVRSSSTTTHATASPATVTGLVQGASYSFTVSAVNAAGEGAQSAASNSVATAVAPASHVHAMGGDGRATVSFAPPTLVGPSPIASYLVTASPGGLTASGPASPIRVEGLANGTAYTFTVTSQHVDASMETSSASNSVTPARLGPRLHPWAYVPSEVDNLVAVIDTSTDKVINTIDVGPGPAGAAASLDGTRVYTTNIDSVSVIDTASQSVIATIPVPDGPFSVAVNPAGTRVYTANLGGATVSVIDAASNTVIATIPLPGAPLGIDVDRTGNSIYVSFPLGQAIVRIDAATNTIAETSGPLSIAPAGIEAETSSSVYLADFVDGQVATLSGVTQQSVTAFPDSQPGGGIVMDPADGNVYFTRDPLTSNGTVNRLAGGSAPVGAGPVGIAVTPTGSKLYVANRFDDTVSVIDAASMTTIATIPVGQFPVSLGRFIAPRDANPPRLANISTRTDVLTGDNVMIAGFIIGGSTPKTVAITATGPSLVPFGITNPLANPTLMLVRQSDHAVIATNDDWQADANASQLLASGFAPTDPHEAGLYVTLPPGAYTAIVQDAGGGSGVSVAGVFELDHPELPLVNISTRAFVQGGNNVMIAGLIVQGSAPQTVAITATGPSLVPFGITDPLANPTLTLVRQSDHAVIAANDDWQADANASQLQASGFAPTNPLEAGLLVTLAPGAYTAIVSGVNGTTGVSVVGVFAVP